MRSRSRLLVFLVLPFLVSSALMLKACGNDDATTDGCAEGTAFANDTDVMTISDNITRPDATYYFAGPAPIRVLGGVLVTVEDSLSQAKNNMCLVVYTDGILWDRDYTTQLQDANGRYVTKTDMHGQAVLYFATSLFVSNPSTSADTIDGEDYNFQWDIDVRSGGKDVGWTMTGIAEGCKAGTAGSCP